MAVWIIFLTIYLFVFFLIINQTLYFKHFENILLSSWKSSAISGQVKKLKSARNQNKCLRNKIFLNKAWQSYFKRLDTFFSKLQSTFTAFFSYSMNFPCLKNVYSDGISKPYLASQLTLFPSTHSLMKWYVRESIKWIKQSRRREHAQQYVVPNYFTIMKQ